MLEIPFFASLNAAFKENPENNDLASTLKHMLAQCLDILSTAEESVYQQRLQAFNLLPKNSAMPLVSLAIEAERILPHIRCYESLFSRVETIYSELQLQKSLIYRPFEIFWGSPYEREHTALLKYFLDPREDHDVGNILLESLLKTLFATLKVERPVDRCSVSQEHPISNLDKRGFIDLLITRKEENGQYAVILENKVNGALDTDVQLFKYKEYVKTELHFQEVYIIYLPLLDPVMPSENSLGDIRKDPACRFEVLTFDKFILPWLAEVCLRESIPEEMHDNLKHYRDFILFLIKKNKEQKMKDEILKVLREKDEGNNLPAFRHVRYLKESMEELILCYKILIRSKLLCNIYNTLKEEGAGMYFARDHLAALNSLSDSGLELDTQHFCAVGMRINMVTVAIVGVDLFGNADTLRVWFGDRGLETMRDKSFEGFIEKREGVPIPYCQGSSAWYHWEERQVEFDKWKEQAERIARDLREYWKTLTQITAEFGIRYASSATPVV